MSSMEMPADNMPASGVDENGWFHAAIGAYVVDDVQGYINSMGVNRESLCVMIGMKPCWIAG